MDYIKASDDIQVYRKSSIDQHKNKFSVYRKGGWLPISYDVLDDVTCEGLVSHRDEHRIVNSDTGALGTTNVTRYRIGLDYYQAIKNLPAVE